MLVILMECLRCGRCCTSFGVCITLFDIIRIAEATGTDPINFVMLIPEPPERERTEPAILINGKYLLLVLKWKHKKGQTCCFYDKKLGCLAYDSRPMLCRTYPFRCDGCKLKNMKSRACPKFWIPADSKQYLADIQVYEKELREYKKITDEWNAKAKGNETLKEFVEFALKKININI